MKILGTPVGSDRFVEAVTEERLSEERRLWEVLERVPDLQCAWQILLQCAGPRTVPPSQSAQYAAGHDMGMRKAMETVLGSAAGTVEQRKWAQ